MSTKRKDGSQAVREIVLGAAPARNAALQDIISNYFANEFGIFRKSDDPKGMLLCGPLRIEAATTSLDDGTTGYLVAWTDRDGLEKREIFAGDRIGTSEMCNRLLRAGLFIHPGRVQREALAVYLAALGSTSRIYCTSRSGWHRINGANCYVLQDCTIGAVTTPVILQTAVAAPFAEGGTLEDWQERAAARCAGNSRLTFALSCAFAAPLLELTGDVPGGFSVFGKAKTGKTALLTAAASVWGGTPADGARGFVRSWRTTSNALESVATVHSDALLPIDELAEADPEQIGQMAYSLGNGTVKSRSDRSGTARPTLRFRTLFLSSGETTLATAMATVRQQMRAGQGTRFIDLRADAGKGLGVLETLHGQKTASAFLDELYFACRQNYGVAIRPFLRFVVDLCSKESEFPDTLRERVSVLQKGWLLKYPNADPQVLDVARRFALCAVAGELAATAGVVPWGAGEAEGGVHACFMSWLRDRGDVRPQEDAQAEAQLRGFIAQHGGSRFEDWRAPDPADQDAKPPVERHRTLQRAGWRKWETLSEDGETIGDAGWTFCIIPDVMHQILQGLDFRSAIAALVKAGLILPNRQGASSTLMQPPGVSKQIRLYRVPSYIVSARDEDGES